MTKTYVQVLIALLLALFVAGGATANETKDGERGEVKPMQCIWFLQNCAPPPSEYAYVIDAEAKQD